MEELIHQIGEKEVYIAQDFLPHIEKLAEKCSWSSGKWDFGNGDSATGVNPSYTYTEAGSYTVTLTVADGVGNSDTDTIVIDAVLATTCQWNDLADSNLEKIEAQSAKVGDKLYVFAGFLPGLIITNATEIYDTVNDEWNNGAPMPIPVTHMGIAVVGTDIWVVSGFAGTSRTEIISSSSLVLDPLSSVTVNDTL